MRWFRSDDHLGHKGILTLEPDARPFADNADVAPDDTVIHVGDLAWTDRWIPRVMAEWNGRWTLVSGNHDPTFQLKSDAAKARRRYLTAGFVDVVDGLELTLADGTDVLVNHFPYHGDHGPTDRYVEVRPRDDGLPLICGHIHSKWRTLDRMVNVGVDAWDLSPVPEDALIELFSGGA